MSINKTGALLFVSGVMVVVTDPNKTTRVTVQFQENTHNKIPSHIFPSLLSPHGHNQVREVTLSKAVYITVELSCKK